MRFLRGIGVSILSFFLFLLAGMVVISNTVGLMSEESLDFTVAMQEAPIWTVLMLIGFFGMVLGPAYYWIIEPFREKRKNQGDYK